MECPYCRTKISFWSFKNVCKICNKKFKIRTKFVKFFLIMFGITFGTQMFMMFALGLAPSAILKAIIAGIGAGVGSRYAQYTEALEGEI